MNHTLHDWTVVEPLMSSVCGRSLIRDKLQTITDKNPLRERVFVEVVCLIVPLSDNGRSHWTCSNL